MILHDSGQLLFPILWFFSYVMPILWQHHYLLSVKDYLYINIHTLPYPPGNYFVKSSCTLCNWLNATYSCSLGDFTIIWICMLYRKIILTVSMVIRPHAQLLAIVLYSPVCVDVVNNSSEIHTFRRALIPTHSSALCCENNFLLERGNHWFIWGPSSLSTGSSWQIVECIGCLWRMEESAVKKICWPSSFTVGGLQILNNNSFGYNKVTRFHFSGRIL